MSDERLQQLLLYYKEEPANPFNIYAVALEYRKSDLKQSLKFFETLLREFPEYLPSYYQAAKVFEETGDTEKAIATYQRGIALAKQKNDLKTARELQSALEELTF